tara:strand:+ start:633 stop:1043 length:411 start_codon:yes stop_codon:yes gene_type:complete
LELRKTLLATTGSLDEVSARRGETATARISTQGGVIKRRHAEGRKAPSDLIRAKIIYCPKSNGGAHFSVGSFCFCGTLNHSAGDNGVPECLKTSCGGLQIWSRLAWAARRRTARKRPPSNPMIAKMVRPFRLISGR